MRAREDREIEWPADQVERWPLTKLIPYARNARTHSDEQIKQIAASIREFGFTNPVLVDEQGTLIAGHGRVLGAHQLGITDVPTMVARGWTPAQIQAYRLADNQLALNAGWDRELLGLELGELKLGGFDLALTGFGELELGDLLADRTQGLTDPDDAPEAPEHPVSRTGDLWLLGRHRLLCGDSTVAADVERVLGGVEPHLMVTDPPYGVNYDPSWHIKAAAEGKIVGSGRRAMVGTMQNDDRTDWAAAWSLFRGDVAYIWHASVFGGDLAAALRILGFDIRSQIVWAKHTHAIGRGHYHWRHETCWYAVRGTSHWRGDHSQTTLWHIDKIPSDTGHGTQKPVECMKRPIENNSSPGQAIYEPFSKLVAVEICHRSRDDYRRAATPKGAGRDLSREPPLPEAFRPAVRPG
jgi:hypothetical protein